MGEIMSCSAVLGAQWGDEGKGKIVDMYSEQAGTKKEKCSHIF